MLKPPFLLNPGTLKAGPCGIGIFLAFASVPRVLVIPVAKRGAGLWPVLMMPVGVDEGQAPVLPGVAPFGGYAGLA